MERYMTNSYHFTGPRLFRPRGPTPFQFRVTQPGFGQTRPMGMGPGLPNNRFRFPQDYLQQAPIQYPRSPGGNNSNGAPFMYYQQPHRFSLQRFEGPQMYSWNSQYRPHPYYHANLWNPVQRVPYHRNISLRGGGCRRPFLQGRNISKISSEAVPEKYGTLPAPQTMSLVKIKQELQHSDAQEVEVDSFTNFICGNDDPMPQENDGAQLASVSLKQEPEHVGTGGGDSSRVFSMAVQCTIKQEIIVDDVAVGSELCLKRDLQLTNYSNYPSFKRFRGECGNASDYSMYSSEEESLSPSNSEKVEEYEPENPAIIIRKLTDIYLPNNDLLSEIKGSELISRLLFNSTQMASRDEDGFDEAWVGVCVSRYPSTLGRMLEVAGYGIWFSDENKSNFSGVMDIKRPQNLKAVMIRASSRALEAMKAEGCTKVRINLETEYLNQNVLAWIQKYREDPKAQSSNWDEYKYHPEILDLCAASDGMIIKWSHCSETSIKKIGLCKANVLAKKATDAWMKDVQFREEAVGTS